MRKKRTDVVDANLEGDEQEETVFIDNLPDDELAIQSMLSEVKKQVRLLEQRFFEEEDSDFENDEMAFKKLEFEKKSRKIVDPAEKALLKAEQLSQKLQSSSSNGNGSQENNAISPLSKQTPPICNKNGQNCYIKQFWCIPLSFNVMQLDFSKLGEAQRKFGGRMFDIITMDPPWQLSTANPTRGVAIAYDTLKD